MFAVKKLWDFIRSLVIKKVVLNTVWILLSKVIQIFIQFYYFVFITRALGPSDYGGFMAVLALTYVVAPFSSWGRGALLVRNVSRDPASFSYSWGNALLVTVCFGSLFSVAIVAISPWVLPQSLPLALVIYITISLLIFDRLTLVAGYAFQALQRLEITALLNVLSRLSNLVAAAIFVGFDRSHDLILLGQIYLGTVIAVSIISFILVQNQLGSPRLDFKAIIKDLKHGFYLSIGMSSQTIYNHIDKTMLAKLSTLSSTGAYAAGFRLVQIATIPIVAIGGAAYAKFFQKGEKGIQGSWSLAKRLLPISVGYSALASLALYFGAGYAPLILGEEFSDVVEVIRWLAIVPLLRTLHFFPSDALTAADRHSVRTSLQAGTAILNVVLNFWWIPLLSWRGAVASTLACDLALAIGLIVVVQTLVNREARGQEHLVKERI